MIKDVIFCGVDAVRGLKNPQDIALISILDKSEASCRPDLSQFAKVICFDFEDTSEESKLMPADSFGDYPTMAQCAQFAQGKGERVVDLHDAKAILDFVDQAMADPKPMTLAIHCYAGMSRSAAVAQFVSQAYGIDLDSPKGTAGANPRLLRLLTKSYKKKACS